MKIKKLSGFHKYQVFTDNNIPACTIEMTPAITDKEKEEILSCVRRLTPRAVDRATAADYAWIALVVYFIYEVVVYFVRGN